MVHDIYNILTSDRGFITQLETIDEITIILQQIRMVLGTKPGEVLGSPTFGLNLQQYLFNLSYNKNEITELVQNAILRNIQYDSTKYTISINVNFGKDHINASDYAVIDISINEKKCLGVMITQ